MKSAHFARIFGSVFAIAYIGSSNSAPPDYDLIREAGDIKGNVTICGEAKADVLVYAPGTSFSAFTDGGGNFKLSYVQEGIYDLVVKKAGVALGTISQVAVVKKQTLDIGPKDFCIDHDNDGFSTPYDCDDNNPAINPNATEVCGDGIDNNCNHVADEDCAVCTDKDGDSFYAQSGCSTAVDCNDADASINPQASESCDAVDNNCNGVTDESATDQTNFYRDADGDGYGTIDDSVLACAPLIGYVSQPGDCNDSDPSMSPGVVEVCGDNIDNNCNGAVDEDCLCADPAICDDGLACTIDTCDPTIGCTSEIAVGSCLIAGACYTNGSAPDACRYCDSSSNSTGWTFRPPGSYCGENAACNGSGVCVVVP